MSPTRPHKAPENTLGGIAAEEKARIARFEAAVGQLAADLHGVAGSSRLAGKAPELAQLMALHERRIAGFRNGREEH